MGRAERVEHHEVLDHARVAGCGHGNPGCCIFAA
jgi:hypothetical protein